MAHAVLLPDTQTDVYLAAVRKQMSDQFDIEHITVQCEFEPCSEAAGCEWDAVRHAGHDHDIDAGHEDDPPTPTRLPLTDRSRSEHRGSLPALPRSSYFQ